MQHKHFERGGTLQWLCFVGRCENKMFRSTVTTLEDLAALISEAGGGNWTNIPFFPSRDLNVKDSSLEVIKRKHK